MTHQDEIYDESGRKKPEFLLKESIAWLDKMLENWKNEIDAGFSVLTSYDIDFLRILAEKNARLLSNKQGLSDPQKSMKTEIHQRLRNAFFDIDRMITCGFIGISDIWNPAWYGHKKVKYPYDVDTWREDFPVAKVTEFVKCLVRMYGDDYAVPIAEAIKQGLQSREEWGGRTGCRGRRSCNEEIQIARFSILPLGSIPQLSVSSVFSVCLICWSSSKTVPNVPNIPILPR
jgi:uncharacterized protein YbaA (DUF1428 family)